MCDNQRLRTREMYNDHQQPMGTSAYNSYVAAATAPAEPQLDPYTMIPALSQHLHEGFGGPHTQFACSCFYVHQNGSLVPCQLVVSCTQIFLCDADAFVVRVALINRLLAVYHRVISAPASQGGSGNSRPEQELLLVFDREHDLLLRGNLVCDGSPPKPLLQTLLSLQKVHCPTAPVAMHMNSTVPLKEVAKLKPPQGYVAPLPQREESWELCPCWRAADVLNISDDEFATRLRNLCIVYCPEKLANIPELCRKYSRKKGGVLQHMVQQYGPEPTEEHAMSVYKVLQREEKFADILRDAAAVLPSRRNQLGSVQSSDFMGASAGIPGQTVPLSTLLKANKKLKDNLIPDPDPLYFPLLKLIDQPSGGYGRIHVRVRPQPYLAVQQDVVCKFARRPNDPHHEFWYLTNEGFVLSFDISPEVMLPFGYEHGDRVMATWGVTRGRWSTIVGVRDGTLWVHDDGDIGATALVGFTCRDELERCNGWIKQEHMSTPLRETSMLEVLTLPDLAPRPLLIAPEIVFPRCGFYHGEVVRCCEPCQYPFDGIAVVAGVDAEDGHTLYVFFVDPSDEGLTQEVLFSQQLKQYRRLQATKNRGNASSDVDTMQQLPVDGSAADGNRSSPLAALRDKNSSGLGTSIIPQSRKFTPSRIAAQPTARCMSHADVVAAYGWRSVGCARVLHYTTTSSGSSGISSALTRGPSVIL